MQQAEAKTQNPTLSEKRGFWNGCREGLSLSVIHTNAVSENTGFIVFLAKHSNCRKKKKLQVAQKQKVYQN